MNLRMRNTNAFGAGLQVEHLFSVKNPPGTNSTTPRVHQHLSLELHYSLITVISVIPLMILYSHCKLYVALLLYIW